MCLEAESPEERFAPEPGGKRVADIVIMGAGLGGAIMAYEMKEQMRREDKLTVVTKDPIYHFVPSNPWVPVGWRDREALEVDLAPDFRQDAASASSRAR